MTTNRRRTRRAKPTPPPHASTARQALREGWRSALDALSRAEADVEARVKALLRKNKINVEDAAQLLREFRKGLVKERVRGLRELDGRFGDFQRRLRQEGRNAAKRVEDAVQSGLAALNIPNRKEVALLTRKVDELSRRIAAQRRPRRKR
jgi:polyhydroxyalkanoate synthesis regulator phasin